MHLPCRQRREVLNPCIAVCNLHLSSFQFTGRHCMTSMAVLVTVKLNTAGNHPWNNMAKCKIKIPTWKWEEHVWARKAIIQSRSSQFFNSAPFPFLKQLFSSSIHFRIFPRPLYQIRGSNGRNRHGYNTQGMNIGWWTRLIPVQAVLFIPYLSTHISNDEPPFLYSLIIIHSTMLLLLLICWIMIFRR